MDLLQPSRAQLSRWTSLKEKKYRRERGQFLIEGESSVREALTAGAPLEAIIVRHEQARQFDSLLQRAKLPVFIAKADDFARLSAVEASQGILAVGNVFELPPRKSNVAILAEQVADPGNCGTLLRTACFFGASVVVFGKGSAEPWNPKVVRGSMGALFRQPFREEENLLEFARNWNGDSVAAVAHGGKPFATLKKLTLPVLLVLGHETRGLSTELANACTHQITLVGSGHAESLNLAAAAAIFLYEITRQTGSTIS
ncbi:MAG: RNA methyltransferase [bacterium]